MVAVQVRIEGASGERYVVHLQEAAAKADLEATRVEQIHSLLHYLQELDDDVLVYPSFPRELKLRFFKSSVDRSLGTNSKFVAV